MHRQIERPPMDRDEQAAAQGDAGFDGLLRTDVKVGPQLIVGSGLNEDGIERTEPLADGREAREHAGVAAVVDAMLATGDDPTGPQRLVLVCHDQRAPREVPRGSRRESQTAELDLAPPVTLDDTLGRDAPVLEMGADAERHDIQRRALAERLHGAMVEVVVVVVRDHDGIDGGQLVDGERCLVKARRPSPGEGGWSLAQHRVHEHPMAVDLDQERRVTEPGDAQATRWTDIEVARHAFYRQGAGNRGPCCRRRATTCQRT